MMKKTAKVSVIVASSVVGAILVAVIVLCSVIMRPMKSFMDYQKIQITTSERVLFNEPLSDPNGAYKSKLDKNLKKTGFSVMHAMLEFVGNYGPEFVKDDDGNNVKRTVVEARNLCAASSDSYMVELSFASEKTFRVGKTDVAYDSVLLNVKSTDGEIHWVTVYPYLSRLDGVQNEEIGSYQIVPVRMRMNTSPLYIAIGEIAADFA